MAALDPTPTLPTGKVRGNSLSADELGQITTALANIAAALGTVDDGTTETVADALTTITTALGERAVLVNTDGNPGITIHAGTTEPDTGDYVVGDLRIRPTA